MLYIVYDVRDGSLVQISEEMVTIGGYPYSIKEIDMPMPDLKNVSWEGNILGFVPKPSRVVTKLDYLRRFTSEERIAIKTLALQVPQLADYLYLMELSTEIDLDDDDLKSALGMLEATGILAEGRSSEILNG